MKPVDIPWEIIPFDFRIDWVYDPEYGWLEFCWLSASFWLEHRFL